MLKFSYEYYLANYEFDMASIFSISPKTFLVALTTNIEMDLDIIFAFNSYVFSEGKMLKHLPQFHILDVKKESQQITKIAVFNKKGLKGDVFQPFVQGRVVQEIDTELYQLRIMDQRKGIAISYDQKKLQLVNFKGEYNNTQTIKTIYDFSFQECRGLVTTLSLFDKQTVLFHTSGSPFHNDVLNCMDIQYQSISWKQESSGDNFMLKTIVKLHQKTFLNGNIDGQQQIFGSLKLYDLRVKGNVLNVLDFNDEIFWQLQLQQHRGGFLRSNFDQIRKGTRPFQIVGMINIRNQECNFPYILDMRRPNHIIPFDYPNGKHINHIKTFEVVNNQIIAIERLYSIYRYKKANICSYQMIYPA